MQKRCLFSSYCELTVAHPLFQTLIGVKTVSDTIFSACNEQGSRTRSLNRLVVMDPGGDCCTGTPTPSEEFEDWTFPSEITSAVRARRRLH